MQGPVEKWFKYISLKYSNVKTLEIDSNCHTNKEDEGYGHVLNLNTNTIKDSMIQVLTNLTKLREHGCRIYSIDKSIVQIINTVNKQLTSIKI